LRERLGPAPGVAAGAVSLVIGVASVAQALVLVLAGHWATRTGRRALFLIWGAVAALVGPLIWWCAVGSAGVAQALVLAGLLQVITVSAYGPVSAYLSERFPTQVRFTGYGMGYSLSLVLPALYPFYLPWVEALLGRQASVMALLVLGGALVMVGALHGPRLRPKDSGGDIDEVAGAITSEEKHEGGR